MSNNLTLILMKLESNRAKLKAWMDTPVAKRWPVPLRIKANPLRSYDASNQREIPTPMPYEDRMELERMADSKIHVPR